MEQQNANMINLILSGYSEVTIDHLIFLFILALCASCFFIFGVCKAKESNKSFLAIIPVSFIVVCLSFILIGKEKEYETNLEIKRSLEPLASQEICTWKLRKLMTHSSKGTLKCDKADIEKNYTFRLIAQANVTYYADCMVYTAELKRCKNELWLVKKDIQLAQ